MSSGVTLFALGSIALAARSFVRRGDRRLVVIAKATCKIVPEGPFVLVAPRAIVASERFLGGMVSSTSHPGDLALRMPRAQILVVGAAYPPGGQPAKSVLLRLAVARGESMLVDKRLEVIGDRRGPPRPSGIGVQLADAGALFSRMPLVYERAFGGPGFPRNPVGVGAATGQDGLATLPNLHHASGRVVDEPPGLGPISSLWPARRQLLGATPRQAADQDLHAQLADDFGDDYFVSAPSDQTFDAWQGGEMIALLNAHASFPALRMHLPRWTVSALLQTQRGVRAAVPMRLDTLLVEPDTMSAELLFRGDIRVDDEALRGARVGAAIGPHRIEIEDLFARGDGVPAESFAMGAAGQGGSGGDPRDLRQTMLVADEPTAAEPPAATPFEARRGRAGTMVIESSPPPPRPAAPLGDSPRAQRRHNYSATMILEAPGASPPRAVGPADAGPGAHDDQAPMTQVMGGEPPRRVRAATLAVDMSDDAPISLPFERKSRTSSLPAPPTAPLPGAPWSPRGGERPVVAASAGIDSTLADEATATDVRPPLVIPPPPEAELPAPPALDAPAPPALITPPVVEKEVPRASPWREDPATAPVAPPLPRPVQARTSFKSNLYQRFKK